jgi:hypothetical protein
MDDSHPGASGDAEVFIASGPDIIASVATTRSCSPSVYLMSNFRHWKTNALSECFRKGAELLPKSMLTEKA